LSVVCRLLSLLQRYAAHRDPHSFPTRRSSDLAAENSHALARGDLQVQVAQCRLGLAGIAEGQSAAFDLAAQAAGGEARPALLRRSEEHTSELQSRENLVCRLLLEKKKKQTR